MSASCHWTISKPVGKFRRLLKWLGFLALAMVVGLGMVSWAIDWFCISKPPTLQARPPILDAPLVNREAVASVGGAWISKKDGIIRMYLSGDPFTLGYTNARLTQQYMTEQEASLLTTVAQMIPSPTAVWLLKKYVCWRNRNLPDYITADYQMEICGLSQGYLDSFPEIGPIYHRLLNYHAAHDISHAIMDNPISHAVAGNRSTGCTSFAAWGQATGNGHLIVGRNFDFSAGKCFDADKIVVRVKPSKGLEYLSVAWGGMVGVVSGMNEAGISVTINAAQSADKRQIGTPVSLVMREVLQHAETLDQAIAIIRESKVFVSDSYLVASRKASQAVVVEKTPGRCAVRKAEGDTIICSNHFLTDDLKDDQNNLKYMAEGTSVQRYHRMEELVKKHRGNLYPEQAAAILRDRELPGGKEGGYGNAAAINSVIATHSVIMDLTDGIIWVSRYPHQLGPYVPFRLGDRENPSDPPVIPPDLMLTNGSYERFEESQKLLASAQERYRQKDLDAAWMNALRAGDLNPGFYGSWFLLGRIAFEKGEVAQARDLLRKAQDGYPAYLTEREEITRMLAEAEQRLGAGKP